MAQPPQYNPNNNRQRMPSAWQPAAPTSSSLQAAAGSNNTNNSNNVVVNGQQQPQQAQQQQQQQQQQGQPISMGAMPNPYAYGPPGGPHPQMGGYHPAAAVSHHLYHGNPYFVSQRMWGQAPPYYPQAAMQPPPNHQPMPNAAATPQQQQPPQPPIPQSRHPQYHPPPPRRALVITDRDGNVVDLKSAASSKSSSSGPSSLAAAAARKDHGNKLKEAALKAIKEGEQKKQEAADAERRKKEEEEERRRKEAERKKFEEEERKRKAEETERKRLEEEERKRVEEEQRVAREAAERKKREEEAEAERKRVEREEAERKKREREEAERKRQREAAAAKLAEEEAKRRAQQEAPRIGLRPGGKSPPTNTMFSSSSTTASTPSSLALASNSIKTRRHVYSKQDLLRFKEMDVCICRPPDLPDMTIERGPSRTGGGGGGGPGGGGGRVASWKRGMPAPHRSASQSNNIGGGGGGGGGGMEGDKQWRRGQAPPPPKNNNGPNNRNARGGGGRVGYHEPPTNFKPLVKSENRWIPRKNTSALVVAEKKVKSILNKMTKEKFDRLSKQMTEIPLESYDILKMMIGLVYEKAIDEPSFGDMYADLCALLSKAANTSSFVHFIESDEEQENGTPRVFRWSNDVSTSDAEVMGPFGSENECFAAAIKANTEEGEGPKPIQTGDMKLELVSLKIQNSVFIKVMKHENKFYTVYFPLEEAKECGQQLSSMFLTERECQSDASKHNSFKRSLLNKCEDEFNKQDIYVDWKAEKKSYLESKSKLTESEQAEKEEELDFRRMKIKKQMLGNIKFIGQLYKKCLLKEKIMRYCIASLLKLKENEGVKSKNPEYKDSGEMDMDEEDHEAACSMFTTIGKTIDTSTAASFMRVCFTKMTKLSNDKSLSARSRFMYKDLLELRANRWEPRRKQEGAKTLDEIRKDVEREERLQAQQAAQQSQGSYGRGGGRGGISGVGRGGGRGMDHSNNRRNTSGGYNQGSSRRQPRQIQQTDDDGFTTIVGRGSGRPQFSARSSKDTGRNTSPKSARSPQPPLPPPPVAAAVPAPTPAPVDKPLPAALSKEKLERRVDNMRAEFMQDPSNTEELFLSMDELSGTPDAGLTLVQKYSDRIMDCKDDERKAIVTILALLYKNNKLAKDDVRNGMMDALEFIDSFVIDAPRAYEYLADMLSAMFDVKAIDVAWLCEQCEKTKLDPGTQAPTRVVQSTMEAVKTKYGKDTAMGIFGDGADKLAALLGNDKWNEIASKILG